ncbi:P-loop containing nucleoside triphosphate hydrolase protein [Lentinula raphanica]|uniref:P-loop containing nucleoside triphosphate hydrolase protein n=1 Tax=Lentinula raphanica TaxID=153919 RepID=A0AA38PAV4_9AGAR|nr:P-loop containing nucleoside triphosphate hydrolase protein [Lentinula raphanica]KAJ3839510.1 P-loop containing nucleoside triphosphate hydrolase protein [Lentinula raphanica]
MDTFRSLVQPLVGPSASSAGMIDGMKLVVLGGTVETARRMGSRAWNHFVNSFFLTAHFSEDDYPYDWLMLWLSRRPEWQRSREFETTTRLSTPLSGGSNSSSSRTADNSFGDEDYREWWNETAGPADDHPEIYSYNEDDIPGKVKTRVVFQPTFDTTHTIYYRGHWLRVRRWRKGDNMNNGSWGGSYGYSSGGGGEMLSVSVVARSNTILKQLVLQAKREYEAEAIHRIQIYFADSHGGWRWTDSRHKRPMSSIVLNPGVKEMLLNDTKDFLNSEKWYADRGIPFRRGYLLHGVPGSGKSSLIHAIAGELMLDIYALSLSAAWINDATLTTLMGRVPARCIVLLEDLDAAFTRSTGRRSKKDKKDKKKKDKKDKKKSKDKSDSAANGLGNTSGVVGSGSSSRRRRTGASGINGGANATDAMSDVNTLSLSGLLNALDGVAAAEGRLLFATTNHLDHLDPALSRPGRMDVWIEFKNASQWQAEALFRNFFPSCEEDSTDHHREDVTSRAPTPTPASPSSLSLSSLGSAVWSMPSFVSSTASLVTGAVGAVTGSSPGTRSRTASSPSPPRTSASGSPKSQPRQKTPRTHSSAPLSPSVLSRLAKEFAQKVPDEEFSVASLQGYLLRNKSRPEDAVKGVDVWVEEERRNREKQKGAKKKAKEDEARRKRKERRKEKAKEKEEQKEKEKTQAEPAPVKKSKSKSKSKKSKHTEKSDEDDSDSDSSSSSSDSDDHESSSDSDSDSSSDSSSDDEDENTGPRPRPSTSSTLRTSSFPPSSSFQNSSSSWSVDPSSWEVAVPPNNSWGGW